FREREARADRGREVEHEREVVREVGPLRRREIDPPRVDARRLDLLALARGTEARDAPDLVVPGEGLRDGKGDAAGGAGDQDLLVAQRSLRVPRLARHARASSSLRRTRGPRA